MLWHYDMIITRQRRSNSTFVSIIGQYVSGWKYKQEENTKKFLNERWHRKFSSYRKKILMICCRLFPFLVRTAKCPYENTQQWPIAFTQVELIASSTNYLYKVHSLTTWSYLSSKKELLNREKIQRNLWYILKQCRVYIIIKQTCFL